MPSAIPSSAAPLARRTRMRTSPSAATATATGDADAAAADGTAAAALPLLRRLRSHAPDADSSTLGRRTGVSGDPSRGATASSSLPSASSAHPSRSPVCCPPRPRADALGVNCCCCCCCCDGGPGGGRRGRGGHGDSAPAATPTPTSAPPPSLLPVSQSPSSGGEDPQAAAAPPGDLLSPLHRHHSHPRPSAEGPSASAPLGAG